MERSAENNEVEEKPDAFWRKVYFAVIVVTVAVITALWAFTEYFSS